jgi:hypothetical protein
MDGRWRKIVYSDGYYFGPVLRQLTLPWLGIGSPRQQALPLEGAFVRYCCRAAPSSVRAASNATFTRSHRPAVIMSPL